MYDTVLVPDATVTEEESLAALHQQVLLPLLQRTRALPQQANARLHYRIAINLSNKLFLAVRIAVVDQDYLSQHFMRRIVCERYRGWHGWP